jgi:hypothetical protein
VDELAAIDIQPVAEVDDDRARIVLTVDIPDNVHIEPHEPADPFLIPTVVTANGLDDVSVEYPAPTIKDLGWHDAVLTVLQGRLEFVITGRIPHDVSEVAGGLSYQPCVGGACLPPRTTVWSVPLRETVGA